MSLLVSRVGYKPFEYPWAYQAWEEQQRIHWLPEEVTNLGDDVYDWQYGLTDAERNVALQILRFFTQSDIEVSNCYMRKYANFFKPVEVNMMLAAFSNMETIHIAAYSHLIDTLQLPESEYEAFMQYKTMREKHSYLDNFDPKDTASMLETMAVFGAFTEGLMLFASFALLLNFQRFKLLKGTGQIVTWSVRDESLHCASIIQLFRTLLDESPGVDRDKLKNKITERCREVVIIEDAFIDEAFSMGEVRGITNIELKRYIRYIADRRLEQLGYEPIYHVAINPLPWLDEILNGIEFASFFETRATEYSKAATGGTWSEVFALHDEAKK